MLEKGNISVIIEIRTYRCKVGMTGAFLKFYERDGLALQAQHLGEPIGFFMSEIGDLNEIVHLWRFESLADRETRREALQRDEKWHEFLRNGGATDCLVSQSSTIYRPASFSKIR
ncbi:MAG TPA: NIPSNAP family protein [Trinickia sp.]|jgi:hypothetical protein|nr:NIPSNAP family protein [Trinickia sp.]